MLLAADLAPFTSTLSLADLTTLVTVASYRNRDHNPSSRLPAALRCLLPEVARITGVSPATREDLLIFGAWLRVSRLEERRTMWLATVAA